MKMNEDDAMRLYRSPYWKNKNNKIFFLYEIRNIKRALNLHCTLKNQYCIPKPFFLCTEDQVKHKPLDGSIIECRKWHGFQVLYPKKTRVSTKIPICSTLLLIHFMTYCTNTLFKTQNMRLHSAGFTALSDILSLSIIFTVLMVNVLFCQQLN